MMEPPAANDQRTSRDAVRIPRLTYRNRLSQNRSDSIEPMPEKASSEPFAIPEKETYAGPELRKVPTATLIEWSLAGRPSGSAGQFTKRSPVAYENRRSGSVATNQSAKKSTRRGISLLGFWAVKEPSANALEQYAKQQQRQAGAKSSMSLVATSHQKMPYGVPKVNSKWDGLPDTIKSRPSTSADMHRTARSSSSSSLSTTTKDSIRSGSTASASTVSTIDFAPTPRTPTVEVIGPRPGNLASTRQDSGTGGDALRSKSGGLLSVAERTAQPHPNISEVAPWAEPPL